jgi:anti-sigma factor RsiW
MKKDSDKMNCKHYSDRIEDYLGGKLSEEEKLSFDDHLKICPDCTELVRIQKIMEGIISEEKNLSPGFYLTGRIMDRIKNSGSETKSALIRILKPAVITISIAAAIFAGILIGNFSSLSGSKAIPVELMMMNDVSMESVNLLTNE